MMTKEEERKQWEQLKDVAKNLDIVDVTTMPTQSYGVARMGRRYLINPDTYGKKHQAVNNTCYVYGDGTCKAYNTVDYLIKFDNGYANTFADVVKQINGVISRNTYVSDDNVDTNKVRQGYIDCMDEVTTEEQRNSLLMLKNEMKTNRKDKVKYQALKAESTRLKWEIEEEMIKSGYQFSHYGITQKALDTMGLDLKSHVTDKKVDYQAIVDRNKLNSEEKEEFYKDFDHFVNSPSYEKYHSQYTGNNKAVIYRLINQRGLDAKIVTWLISKGYLRADKHHNAHFLWIHDGKIVGGEAKGTQRMADGKTFAHLYTDNASDWGFNIVKGNPKKVIYFEAAIDLLSFLTLNAGKDILKDTLFMAMSGLKRGVIDNVAKYYGDLDIYLAFDNDDAGRKATEDIKAKYNVKKVLVPVKKDWNDDLQELKGIVY